ncbi:YrrS family protein [Psychrobacillus sp. L4]|uniref:YrrS family protein n=1 Tax=Psychrobacillus sp. L4 TaxID=3236892 RepID=UPI0036F3AC71
MSNYNNRPNSRLNKNNRKKKGNNILNILIGVVLLLIIIVVVNIVTDKGTDSAKVKEEAPTNEEVKSEDVSADNTDEADKAAIPAESNEVEKEANKEIQTSSVEEESKNEGNVAVVTEPSDNSKVDEITIDPTWTPIGTTQTGEHVSSYDKESVDWTEKVKALSYGSGLDASNMYVKHLGNGGSPQKSVGTVTSKDGKEIYRIQLEWIDGQGWKPTKKEKLKSLDDAS